MFIEYFPEGRGDTPMLLLYGRDWEQCQTLCDCCLHLAEGKVKRVALNSLPGFECIGGCQLWGAVAGQDFGVTLPPGSDKIFECRLTRPVWGHMAELLQPLCRPQPEETDIFHTLDRHGAVALVVSTAREW